MVVDRLDGTFHQIEISAQDRKLFPNRGDMADVLLCEGPLRPHSTDEKLDLQEICFWGGGAGGWILGQTHTSISGPHGPDPRSRVMGGRVRVYRSSFARQG